MASPSELEPRYSSISPSSLPRPLPDEQLLFAAKTDAGELLSSIFTDNPPEEYDVNFQDGLGQTGAFQLPPEEARDGSWEEAEGCVGRSKGKE